jgi:pyruvate dehydrogenase E1 component alpha subunit
MDVKKFSPDFLKQLYVTMLRIRIFEERVADLITNKEIICPCHLYIGQEGVATGVCAALRKDDYVLSTHRSHGHFLAKGGDMKRLMAELYCRRTGTSKGRGGSMHIALAELGLIGSSAIVGGTIPIAVGSALAFKTLGKNSVAVAFFGDGAVCEGIFYESLNFASLKKLPVIFVCENNFYSTHMPTSKILADVSIYRKAEIFAMPGIQVDGNNVLEVYERAKDVIENARKGEGPALLECRTYRWRGHVGPSYDLDKGLRSEEELKFWMDRCPIRSYEVLLTSNGILTKEECANIINRVKEEVEDAVKFAKRSQPPESSEEEVLRYVFK